MLIASIVLVVLGIVSLLVSFSYNVVIGWVLIVVGVIVYIVKLVSGKKDDSVTPPPAAPMQ
jgi:multisubunit Na+/H+ antiporter MnhC subunit